MTAVGDERELALTARAAIPWEERPAGAGGVVWRSSRNPIIPRDAIPRANSIFNSAVVPFGEAFAGVFRVDDRERVMNLHAGRSADGVDWEIDHDPIVFAPADARVPEIQERFLYAYDPRVTWLEDRYYVTWCNGYHGPTIGLAYTYDFETFHQLDNAFLPFNRNGVLFPRKIGGSYAMLSRPSDDGHTPFGDIHYSESPDLVHWGRHRHVMAPVPLSWQSTKIGAGPTPIETDAGWLVLYHGVLTSCNGFVYSMGAALLDLDEPWKVLARGRDYLLVAAGARTSRSATCRTSSFRAPRSSIGSPTASRSTTAEPTRSSASRTDTCRRSSSSFGETDERISHDALVHERELRGEGARLRRRRRVGTVRPRDERGIRADRDVSGAVRRPPHLDHGDRLRDDRPLVRAPQLALGDARPCRDRP